MVDECKVCGEIKKVVFYNEQNGYAVAKLKEESLNKQITVVGIMPEISEGENLEIHGEWTTTKHGKQVSVHSFISLLPSSTEGILTYLSSGIIKGVGPALAKRITDEFGKDTLKIIDSEPEKLLAIRGIKDVKLKQIIESVRESKGAREVILFLSAYHISPKVGKKVYDEYGAKSISVLKSNPYKLADDIFGIGFKTADSIALSLNIPRDAPIRCRAGLLYVAKEARKDGNTYTLRQTLLNKGVKLLGVAADLCKSALKDLLATDELVQEGQAIYLTSLYKAECSVAESLAFIDECKLSGTCCANPEEISKLANIDFDDVQMEAIQKAAKSKVMVLTGGPGTGKTTTIQGLIAMFTLNNMQILLAAPTGRAAKRMSEVTGMEAKTIHRLLEYGPSAGFVRNANFPLEGDVLIVDEASMIDISLMKSLCAAIPPKMRLIIVGDVDQLPSVGPGRVMQDIIESEQFCVVKLTRIFRQALGSKIITNAHAINEGYFPDISNGKDSDFFFIRASEPEIAANTVLDLLTERLPKAYDIKPQDIQVLTPMKKGDAGTNNLNAMIQKAINHNHDEIVRGNSIYRIGDKVMQIKNDYENDIFNGDIGTIVKVDRNDELLWVDFERNTLVVYGKQDLDNLVLSYASTIHKSQGSEYQFVIIPLLMSHYIMLQRNLLYTAITRSKKMCILVGDTRAVEKAVRTIASANRKTMLKDRLIREKSRYENVS